MTKTSDKDPPDIRTDKLKSKSIKRMSSDSVTPYVATKLRKKRGVLLDSVSPTIKNQSTNNYMDTNDSEGEDGISISSRSQYSQAQSLKSKNPFKLPVKRQQKKLKPICVIIKDKKISDFKKTIINLNLEKEFTLKLNSNKELEIVTNSKEDKLKVLDSLKNTIEKLEYHTFTEKEDKNLIYVLKKHYYVDPTDMLHLLQSNDCPATSVQFLNNNPENPSYTVNFPKNSVNLIVLRSQFKVIDHSVVKWENFNNKKKKITQCHKCQRFGHTARNCGHSYRCVKCTDDHLPGQCSRTTKEGNPSCINCKKDHAANNSKCEVLIAYKEKLEKLKKTKAVQPEPRKFVSTQAPWATQSSYDTDYPILGNASLRLKNYRNSINQNVENENNPNTNSQPNDYSDFCNAQKNFSSIPNISETMRLFREMTDKLKNTSCQKNRLSILIEYTMP